MIYRPVIVATQAIGDPTFEDITPLCDSTHRKTNAAENGKIQSALICSHFI